MNAHVARQPIFDKQKNVFAYELLFRDGVANAMPKIDGDMATSKLLSSSFYTIGLDTITAGKRAFINFTENLLIQQLPLMFPNEKTVVEILENIIPNHQVIEACKKIAQKGYIIALDDFVFTPEMVPLIELADIIKFDFRLSPFKEIESYINQLPDKKIKLLAEKIETNDEFNFALDMGFDYFQGYFFCKPEVIKGKEISSHTMGLVQLVAETGKPNFEYEKLELLVSQDVSLSYKLLRYINSAFFKRRKEIASIKDALVYLGQDEIRRFISLIAMAKVGETKPEELIVNACIRAKFCEQVGEMIEKAPSANELFTLGLFSNIDAILDQPMEKIMNEIPLSQSIKNVLVKHEGELMDFLRLVIIYEKADWEELKPIASRLGIANEKLPFIFYDACMWANALTAM